MINVDVIGYEPGIAMEYPGDPRTHMCVVSDVRITSNSKEELDSFLAFVLSSALSFSNMNQIPSQSLGYEYEDEWTKTSTSSSSSEQVVTMHDVEKVMQSMGSTSTEDSPEEAEDDWDPMIEIEIP